MEWVLGTAARLPRSPGAGKKVDGLRAWFLLSGRSGVLGQPVLTRRTSTCVGVLCAMVTKLNGVKPNASSFCLVC